MINSDGQSHAAGRAAARGAKDILAGVDGLFCATDLLALGALDALRADLGRAVPAQIQVVGFDDIEQAAWPAYNLTTIRQNLEEQSALAIELLVERLAMSDRPLRTRLISLTPILRGTSRAPE